MSAKCGFEAFWYCVEIQTIITRPPSTSGHFVDSIFQIPMALRENPERIAGLDIKLVMSCSLNNRPRIILRIPSHRFEIVAHLELSPTAIKAWENQSCGWSRHQILISETTELYMAGLGLPSKHSNEIQETGHNLMKGEQSRQHPRGDFQSISGICVGTNEAMYGKHLQIWLINRLTY